VRRNRRRIFALAVTAAAAASLLAIFVVGCGALVWITLSEEEQAQVTATLGPRVPLLFIVAAAVIGMVVVGAQPFYRRWIAAPARLLERARVLLSSDGPPELSVGHGPAAVRGLAQVINQLARQRDQLRGDIAQEVARASQGVEQERNRLAALMSELTQSVVVCNLDGRILLYNNRARVQFRALSEAPALAGGAELIGLGRSIYAIFDRKLVAHALESVQHRLQRGAASPSAQFVTITRSGQLLRAQMTPVRGVPAEGPGPEAGPDVTPITGFVLMLENITLDYERESERERLLNELTEGSRGSLANLQAAVEMLEDDGLDATMRERFRRVAREEAEAMSRRINELAAQNALALVTRWPLEEMLGTDFVQAAQRRIEASTGVRSDASDIDSTLWLKLDSFSLLQALSYLAQRLRDEFEVSALSLRLTADGAQRAKLDLVWTGRAMSTETVMSWEMEPMSTVGEASSLTVRDVVQRHGGEFWFERNRARGEGFFRFLLPLASAGTARGEGDVVSLRVGSRPEYYDFDLFATTESSRALDDWRLTELVYTVFDTETTGLNPADDEIIQIGAARLVNGKLLRNECFEQLVNPLRLIPQASIAIHGITQEMVAGKPLIDEVLRAFHAYARDTVLVAHNAAFDMRFLQLKQQQIGARFEQPVLDTLLLSAVVHPNQESHQLEAIAERFGITVLGRHTALGDAIVTAEVFLRLVPLLAQMGIHTLGEAREAAHTTYYARLKY
jgi:DNA polymerase-3 subunit epsilon